MSDNENNTPIANPNDRDIWRRAFEFQFGAYGATRVRVFANGCDSALEEAQDYLIEHCPGIFGELTADDYREAAEELGLDPATEDDDEQYRIQEKAETDLIIVGHTHIPGRGLLYIPSWEIHGHELDHSELAAEAAALCDDDDDDDECDGC